MHLLIYSFEIVLKVDHDFHRQQTVVPSILNVTPILFAQSMF